MLTGQELCRNAEIICHLEGEQFGFGKENQWGEGDKDSFQPSPLPCPVPWGRVKGVILKYLRISLLSESSFEAKNIYDIFHHVACVSKESDRGEAR